MTLSPASIMRKSSMALPTCPRRRACRRRKVLEGLSTADMAGILTAARASVTIGRLHSQVAVLDMPQPGPGRQPLARGLLHQLRQRHGVGGRMDMAVQPVGHPLK